MALAMTLSVAQTLLAALQYLPLRDMFSFLGYEPQMVNLERTVNTVKTVLLDAETKGDGELSHQARLFVEELKDAIYDADDLLDELVMKAERKHKKLLQVKEGSRSFQVSEKMWHLVSRIKDLPSAYKMSQGVKAIRQKLDAIADDHNAFGFKLGSNPIRKRREETTSYVYDHDIIGRDDDRDNIVGVLLDPKGKRDVSYLTVVGMGGMGKTALVQLIFNDKRIMKEFPTRIWACVADEDSNDLDVNEILTKILESITGRKNDESPTDLVQQRVRAKLAEDKYLLVLDDVWNEERYQWKKLEDFFKSAPSGSWVVVTTRSSKTTRVVGHGLSYILEGLSDEDSWKLFERVAFEETKGGLIHPILAEMGRKIVKSCANVPLAIRVVGSLLYGQGEDKWSTFQQNGFAEVGPMENNLFSILKFSYHQLDSSLKSCFSYCALFPKDYRIGKEKLVQLWLAQGFIAPLEKYQSLEKAAEEYFLILLRRCFFQDVEKDEYDEILSFKLHDLMHDVAQQVSKMEICSVDHITGSLDKKLRHVSVCEYTGAAGAYNCKSKVRTFLSLYWNKEGLSVGPLISNWTKLRALDLSYSEITSLPDGVGNHLLHLRYLDLSGNEQMEVLPKSFTKLYNLETLILRNCASLRELPTDVSKLVKLRCLDIEGCNDIIDMPAGMGRLCCLHKLTNYIVNLSNPGYGNRLEGLLSLTKLKGRIVIEVRGWGNGKYEKRNTGGELKGRYLMGMQHVCWIKFTCVGAYGNEEEQSELMEVMQPHGKLERLTLEYYHGRMVPSWARGDNLSASLPNLVEIVICECEGFECLAPMGKLPYLRILILNSLRSLKYIEDERYSKPFFPSLEVLELTALGRMKGWWREEEEGVGVGSEAQLLPSFPHLSKLEICGCPLLAVVISVPNIERVLLSGPVNGKLRLREADMEEQEWERGNSNSSPKAREVVLEYCDVGCITSLPSISGLVVKFDNEVERLEQVRDTWWSCRSSLVKLEIHNCNKMKTIWKGGLEYLTALEELHISGCPNLNLAFTLTRDTIRDGGGPLVLTGLRSLGLSHLPQLEELPEWMRHLTSLRCLYIEGCEAIESIPQWMPLLTSLTSLEIEGCSRELEQRCCRSPPGPYWPYIQHISHIEISSCY